MRKLTYKQVKRIFEDGGCELLGEYINCDIKVKYRCSCGNISKILLHNFRTGQRCKECNKNKHSYKYVKKFFEDNGFELLEKEYTNNYIKMRYKYSCGDISKTIFNSFKRGHRCQKCGHKRQSNLKKLTYEEVKKTFEDNGCELLETEYIDSKTKMKYRCSCGNISKIRFGDFKRGYRCRKCSIEKVFGKNHYNYNPNLTDEERKIKRNYPEYKQWIKDIYKKNDYTCQCCFQRGVYLNAHHIQNYSSYKDLRLAVSNGITLCAPCHQKFHSIYGKNSNTSLQLEEFLSDFSMKVLNDDKVIVSV